MSEIVEFLRARLDEDERVATEALEYLGSKGSWWTWASLTKRFSELARADARHMERHSPARVLREVKAKRELINFAFEYAAEVDDERGCGHSPAEIRAGRCTDQHGQRFMEVLMPLTLPYADHPDYDAAWSVDG